MLKTTGRLLAWGYGIYLGLSILVVLPLLNYLPGRIVSELFGRELHSDIIIFNPFALSVSARGVTLPEHSGETFAAVDQAEVNLSLASLWREGVVFDRFLVRGLYLHVRQLTEDEFNFSDLLGGNNADEGADEENKTDDALPAITVADFDFQAREIRYSDEARDPVYSTHYADLSIHVRDLSTVIEEGKPYRIRAAEESGGVLLWEGTVSIPQARSEGRLALNDVALHPFWRFVEPWVQFELHEGSLEIAGDYRVDWSGELAYHVDNASLQISGVNILPKDTATLADTGLAFDSLSVTGIAVDGPAQHVAVEDITLQGLDISGWSEGAQVSLADMFAVDFADSETNAEAAPEPESTPQSGWSANISDIHLDSGINWRSGYTEPALLQITPLTVAVSNVQWPFAGDTRVELNLRLNDTAAISLDGDLELADGAGDVNYRLERLPLPWFNPNLPTALKARISDGWLQLGGRVSLADFTPQRIEGAGDISQFSGEVADSDASLTSWETIRWEGLAVNLADRELFLEKLSIDDYRGRLHIQRDGTINTQKLWQEEVGEEAEELAEDISEGEPWKVTIPAIVMTDSQIDFMDESLPIHFRTVVGDLQGEVLNISSEPGATASVKVKGSVDGYAPVHLGGTVAPFSSPPDLDLRLTFEGVDMALLTPYSGNYAGRKIDRGLLNLDLKYKLDQGHLEGDNQVLIDNLRLGEKIESEDALDLPLDLALTLLTDLNGLIDLRVPVSGDIDDPSFSLGSVIGSALVNLITKAVTAPFNLLGALVGTEEDLQRINFSSGSGALNDAARARLDQLAEALVQRPAVKLIVSGRLHPQADRERLQLEGLNRELLAGGLGEQDLAGKSPAWESAIRSRYATRAPARVESQGEPSLSEQHDWLVGQVQVGDRELQALTEARSVAVKSYLVNDKGMAADRAVIEQLPPSDKKHKFSGVELGVGS